MLFICYWVNFTVVHKSIHKSEIVAYSSEKMYALVSDITSYQYFLPYCSSSSVLSTKGNIVHGQMLFNYFGLCYALETKNVMEPHNRIGLSLLKGDIQTLEGQWLFVDLNPSGCKVSLDLSIEMHDSILYRLYNRIIDQLADSMVDRFVDRALQVYGLEEE